jgi:hypothetical protein
MKRMIGLLMMVVVVGFGGCGESKPTEPSRNELLVGVWGWRKYDFDFEEYIRSTMTFYEDNTYKRVLLYEGSNFFFTITGTWTFKGQVQLVLNELEVVPSDSWIKFHGLSDDFKLKSGGEEVVDYVLDGDKLTIVNTNGELSNYERH